MAHVAKYKSAGARAMIDHYTRAQGFNRDNIDWSRTEDNYVVSVVEDRIELLRSVPDPWDEIRSRVQAVEDETGRKVRKDAVVMADIVITAPPNVPDSDLALFFQYCYQFVGSKVGYENLLGGFVHMDETTPHAHIPFTPIVDGKFSYKTMCPRSFYQTLHRELGDHLELKLGYRPEIEIPEERREEKVLSSVPQEQLDLARSTILGPIYAEEEEELARLERLRREVRAAEEEERRLVEECRGIEEERVRSERGVRDLEGRIEGCKRGIGRLEDSIARLVAGLAATGSAARGFLEITQMKVAEMMEDWGWPKPPDRLSRAQGKAGSTRAMPGPPTPKRRLQ